MTAAASSTASLRAEKLATGTLALYALPAAGITAMHWLLMLYLLRHATDVVGLAPALVASLFAAGRLWDAVTDPLAGWASDRTRSRMGRRRPWMFAAALPLAIGFMALWTPPQSASPGWTAVWLGGALLLFYSAQTAVSIPHAALAVELTTGHHERTRLAAARVVGEFAGMGAAMAGLHWLENGPDAHDNATVVAGVLASLTLVGVTYASLQLREPQGSQGRAGASPYRAMLDVARNPYAARIALVSILTEVGLGSVMVAIPFMAEIVTGETGNSAVLMLGFLGPFVLSIPLWVRLTRRFGKTRCWAFAAAMCAAGFAALGSFGLGSPAAAMALAAPIGFAQAAMMTIPLSVKSDVVDWDEARTGQRKEGSYFAAWNLVNKLGAGTSVAIVGFAIEAPGGSVDPDGVRFVLTVLPACTLGTAALVLLGFRFGEREHALVRRHIEQQTQQRTRSADGAAPIAA